MAQKRYLAPWARAAAATREVAPDRAGREVLEALEGKPALYHCVSRVVDRTFRLGPPEKERFVSMMRTWEAFCQVRVLTFCVMSNHFHILVEVPERPAADPTDGELLDHLSILYRGQHLAQIRWELEHHRKQGNQEAAEALRQRFLRRMWDLSAFMKALKQDFSTWFNQRHERKGHLWEERFKSVLVEDGHAARVVAAYIDLNPVRAGMVRMPEDYRWGGFGEAVAGKPRARRGLRQVMLERELARAGVEVALHEVADWRKAEASYRMILQTDASRPPPRGKAGRGRVAEGQLVRKRVRYFVDGWVIGSASFVDGVFELTRGRFGARRASGARRIVGADTPLRSMRALRILPRGGPGGRELPVVSP